MEQDGVSLKDSSWQPISVLGMMVHIGSSRLQIKSMWGGSCGGKCPDTLPLPSNSNPSDYRYPPFFLLFIIPLTVLNYSDATIVWNLINFALLPLMAFLIWKILSPKNWKETALATGVAFFTLFEPFNFSYSDFISTIEQSFNGAVILFSPSYALEWAEAQTKVFELSMILLALYFVKKKSPIMGGFFLVLSFLDPRFTLMVLPLFFYILIKRKAFFTGVAGILLGVLVLNLPFAFYPLTELSKHGVLGAYVKSIFLQYKLSTFYAYEWIPFFSILSLTIAYAVVEYMRTRPSSLILSEQSPMLSKN